MGSEVECGVAYKMSTSTFSPPLELFPPGDGAGSYTDTERSPSLASPERRGSLFLAKRVVDVVGATVGLILLTPLMLAIAALIHLQTPGPILFVQRRTGQGGRTFRFLKFRTMVADAESRLGPLEASNEAPCGVLFKIRDDPRVTPLGRFLRRSSLDELPQLINVLRGEMSLVGPRPLQLRDCQRLELQDPQGYARRLTVPPGLTGAWQVGGRSETDSNTMLRLDLDYIDRLSLSRDLMILWKTFSVVLKGHGAY